MGKPALNIEDKLDGRLLVPGVNLDADITTMDGEKLFLLDSGAAVTAEQLADLQAQATKPIRFKDFTVGRACIEALMSSFKDEDISNDAKFDRFALAQIIRRGGRQELAAEDITLIKELTARAYGPMVMGQVWVALDPSVKARRLKDE